jgi:7,8-dihydropterin-6-yl-methyl-4-(beta-D-ribofuranosyl)aminobenzene 5'-phosphate synthase
MKLTVLVDNNTLIDRYFLAEPGFCLFIEVDGFSLLFDVGYSDIFMSNAAKMGIDIFTTDAVILSHHHRDHTWGLGPLIRNYAERVMENRSFKLPELIAHPLCLPGSSINSGKEYTTPFSFSGIKEHFHLNLSKKPVFITDYLVFLGEIPRINNFEEKKFFSVRNDSDEPDTVPDDSALVCKTSQGLVIVTGCSHAGICNIVAYARKICKEDRIVDIIGGLHLQNPSNDQMEGTLKYLSGIGLQQLHACHCTDLESKIRLSKIVDIKEVGVGLTIEYT